MPFELRTGQIRYIVDIRMQLMPTESMLINTRIYLVSLEGIKLDSRMFSYHVFTGVKGFFVFQRESYCVFSLKADGPYINRQRIVAYEQ